LLPASDTNIAATERMFDVTGLSRFGNSRFMHGRELPALHLEEVNNALRSYAAGLTALRDRPPSPAESSGRNFTECGPGSKSLKIKFPAARS